MKGIVGSIVTAVVIGLFLIMGCSCSETIPAGYNGIVYNLDGGIEKEVLDQGWKWVAPTKRIITYTVGLEQSFMTADNRGDSTDDESFEIPTKEGSSLVVDVSFSYKFDRDRLPETFTTFKGQDGKEILRTFIKPKMQAWMKEITPEFTLMEIISTKRNEVNRTLTERLTERFDKYGIVIDNVALADVRPDSRTADAIEQRIQAQDELERTKVEANTAKVEANKQKEVAEIEAEEARIKAQGSADAILIKAEAQAKANKMIAESWTQELTDKTIAEKYNGDVPENVTVFGSGSNLGDIVPFYQVK